MIGEFCDSARDRQTGRDTHTSTHIHIHRVVRVSARERASARTHAPLSLSLSLSEQEEEDKEEVDGKETNLEQLKQHAAPQSTVETGEDTW